MGGISNWSDIPVAILFDWVVATASRAVVVIYIYIMQQMATYLTSYSDCLTDFSGPHLPPYQYYTSLKDV